MIDSPLRALAQRRLESLEKVDKSDFPEEDLEDLLQDQPSPPSILKALSGKVHQPTWLLEVKKSSPSKGHLSSRSALELCDAFIQAGADALSVLVDPVNFGGHPKDLRDGCQAHPDIPFLFKDFVASEYQVRLAKAIGASSILLMTQLLEKEVLKDLYQLSHSLGLTPFVETHQLEELEWALDLGADMIGINARDFSTTGLPVHLDTTPKRISTLGASSFKNKILVAQSGLESEEDLLNLLEACPEGLPHTVQIGGALGGPQGVPSWVGNP